MAIITPGETTSAGRKCLHLTCPATLEAIGEIEICTADDVHAAVDIAREAQPAWAALAFKERGQYMLRALNILLERQDDFIDVFLRETPRPRVESILWDILAACESLHYYAVKTEKFLRPQKKRLHGMLGFSKTLRIVYRPLGVVGVISPWNGPFVLSLNPAVQALMAGNTVLIKPSSATPYAGKIIEELFEATELPKGVLTILLGDSTTGEALTESGVDKITFTGSVETGRKIAVKCAERLIPCTLELGGKDPLIVCADANLDYAAGGAVAGSLMNAGQYCCGTERVYVVDSVADEFITNVVDRVSKLRQEESGEYDVGATITPQQLEIIERHVADAITRGAKVLIGGRRNPNLRGLYYEPTVLIDVTHDMLVMREETFGPIIPIMRIKDEEEAIQMANDTDYGLAATVWTKNKGKGFGIARRIDSGSVCVNDMTVTYGAPEAPFGGWKNSGMGQLNGETGLRGYCHPQPILIDRFGGKQTANSYPYSSKKELGFQKMIRFLWGTKIGRRISMLRLPF